MGEDSEDNLSTMDEDILEDNSSMDEDKLKDNSLTDEDEYKCCHCNKLKSQLEYSELPKLEALDFKAVMESISTHLLEAWKSSDSDSEHLMYLIYYFSLKSDHYLYDREYIFSAEKLEAMFRLFEVFVKCQGDFTRLNPNHLDGSKLALLAQQASLLRCYEARGFLENVEDLGMRVLNTAGEDKLLTESDLHMHLTAIYSIMVNVAKSNTNDDRYLRDLLPFVIVKEANELFRSDKEWVGALLCLITKWAHALLKKAKSSDIGSNVASLCWSTLAFLMDSHFNDNESLFRNFRKCYEDDLMGSRICDVALAAFALSAESQMNFKEKVSLLRL
ncbi:hypothetical protein OROMI_006054 [Orobanche minor]